MPRKFVILFPLDKFPDAKVFIRVKVKWHTPASLSAETFSLSTHWWLCRGWESFRGWVCIFTPFKLQLARNFSQREKLFKLYSATLVSLSCQKTSQTQKFLRTRSSLGRKVELEFCIFRRGTCETFVDYDELLLNATNEKRSNKKVLRWKRFIRIYNLQLHSTRIREVYRSWKVHQFYKLRMFQIECLYQSQDSNICILVQFWKLQLQLQLHFGT